MKTMRHPKNDRQIIYNFILHFLHFLAVRWINLCTLSCCRLSFSVRWFHIPKTAIIPLDFQLNEIRLNLVSDHPTFNHIDAVNFVKYSNFSWPTNYSDNWENCLEVCHDDEENLFRSQNKRERKLKNVMWVMMQKFISLFWMKKKTKSIPSSLPTYAKWMPRKTPKNVLPNSYCQMTFSFECFNKLISFACTQVRFQQDSQDDSKSRSFLCNELDASVSTFFTSVD